MSESKEPAEVFDVVSYRLCLDFANTLHDRPSPTARDDFNTYADLIQWSKEAHTLVVEEAQSLLDDALLHPEKAALVLKDAVALREAIYRIFAALAGENSPNSTDLQILNAAYAEAMGNACIIQIGHKFIWDWQGKETALDGLLWDVARSAAELLVSQKLPFVRECAAEDCGWLFLDTSKNHSRRWCDMKGCGNRAKVSRHYEKTQRKYT